MEAIDEFANENIVRSIAFTALEKISTGQYQELLPIASQSLRQRARFLQENWYQWQKDTSLRMIEELVSLPDFTDQLYQRPVYYNRMDADTLYAIVEFAERDTQHFVVILLLEEGNSDISDIKYHNIKEMTEQEWLDVFENWSRSLEEAERIYLTKVARPKKVLASEIHNKHTPDDYWGEWSSDEEGQGQSEDVVEQEREKESEDSEDEYYTRWSKDPGTLTPGPEKSLKVINQQEIEEEYDQSYNPLFTVPSVPNLMDAHTAALSELTQILQTSLPQQQQQQQAKIEKFPGAYPESGAQTPFVEQTRYYQEAGRQLFMKSLSALIGAAKLLGYEGKDILEMVKEIVNKD